MSDRVDNPVKESRPVWQWIAQQKELRNDRRKDTTKRVVAETIGTFCLVFADTGAIVINDVSGGPVTHVGVAFTFGLVVMAMIYAIGDVTGAHLNPAVTFGFLRLPGVFREDKSCRTSSLRTGMTR